MAAVFIGLIEELSKRVSVKIRLKSSATSAFLELYFHNILITKIQVAGLDWLLGISIIAAVFTVIAFKG